MSNDSKNASLRYSIKLAPLFIYIISCVSFAASIEQSPTFVLSTTPDTSAQLRMIDGKVKHEYPGYFGELFATAGEACGVRVEYKFAPWKRVLRMVEYGTVDAAFRSSFKEERAVYGAYPRTASGIIDLERSISSYSYSLLFREGSNLSWNGSTIEGVGRRVAVEVASRGVALAEQIGLQPEEVRDLSKQAQMLIEGRVDAVLAMTGNFTGFISDMNLSGQIKRAGPPVEQTESFLMFSKITYEKYPDQVECFWNEMAAIIKTPQYKARIKFYQSDKQE